MEKQQIFQFEDSGSNPTSSLQFNKTEWYVQKITYDDTKIWLLNLHYAKRMPCISIAFGLFYKQMLMGVCTFGQPASPNVCKGICGKEHKQNVLELNRLIIKDNLPKNILSFFVSKCLKLIEKPKIIVSYSDTGMNHAGYIYQALNFLYTGCGKKRTHIQGKNGKHPRHYCDDFKQRVVWHPKHRYIMFLGTKEDKKIFQNSLKYKILPYPKEQNKNYNINFNILNKVNDLKGE